MKIYESGSEGQRLEVSELEGEQSQPALSTESHHWVTPLPVHLDWSLTASI